MKRVSITSIIVSTAYAASCLCLVAMAPTAAFAKKGKCEGNSHMQCTTYATTKQAGAWYDRETGQWYNKSCRCVANQGGDSSDGLGGSYGHAEVHKKNVPTVKPSGVKPSDIDVHSMRIVPRMPAEVRPSTAVGR